MMKKSEIQAKLKQLDSVLSYLEEQKARLLQARRWLKELEQREKQASVDK